MAALGVVWYAAFIVHITLHEAAHAWAAKRLGDSTAYEGGQVTLNPLPHIEREPVGTVLVPIASYVYFTLQSHTPFMFGWAHAPYNPYWAAHNPRRVAWMAAAGPAANLVIVLFAAIVARVGLMLGFFEVAPSGFLLLGGEGWLNIPAQFVSVLLFLGMLLFTFNLIPVPPLDGAAIIQLFMPRQEMAVRWWHFCQQPAVSIVGMIAAWAIYGRYGHWLMLPLDYLIIPGLLF
jgi:Zn-dependent protease